MPKYSVDLLMLVPMRKTIIVESEHSWEAPHVAASAVDMENWTFATENGPINICGIIKEEIANFTATQILRIVE